MTNVARVEVDGFSGRRKANQHTIATATINMSTTIATRNPMP
jgi:hypothetical protein